MKVSNKSQIKNKKSFPATKSINIYPVPLLIELGKKNGYISDGGETSIMTQILTIIFKSPKHNPT